MDTAIANALALGAESTMNDLTVDITTIGTRSGEPRRIEIWFHNVDGTVYLTGLPGPRAWYANLLANPRFTFHLKHGVHADLRCDGDAGDRSGRAGAAVRGDHRGHRCPLRPARISTSVWRIRTAGSAAARSSASPSTDVQDGR